jgi:Ca2+-binding RTX toxin-like protein
VDQIEVRSVKINDRYVNTNNFLSGTILNDGGSQNVAIGGNDFLFDSSEPASSEFTTGATQTFTINADDYYGYINPTPQIFDMLAGRDVAYLGAGDDKVNGGAGDDVLYGFGGADLLFGAAGDDRIYGGAGNDTLYGGDDNDRVHGDAGDDEIHGGSGNDRLNGGADNDTITGGSGDDKLNGGTGDDFLFGDAGADQLVGGAGNDSLDGGAGDDVIYGGAGIDHINGGDDNDILVGNAGADVIHGDDGDDIMYGGDDNDELYGGIGADRIFGGDGLDTIEGGAGEDELFGGNGNDTIDGGDGHDVIRGGDNNDTIDTGDGDDIIFADGGVNASGWIYKYYNLGSSPTTLATAGFTLNNQMDNNLDATSQGITEDFDPSIFDAGDNYALKYETYLTITVAGNYTFRTRSDDGSMLFLDGVQIVDNDGLHGPATVTSSAQALAAGVYKLDATFFERTGGNVMEVDMSGPDTGSVFVDLASYADVNPANGAGSVLSGDDIINAGAGDDTIFGDQGTDTISADAGDDTIYLANGDFGVGESIDGGADTDEIILTNATTVDFTTGTISNVELLTGSSGNDDVTYNVTTALDFTTIDLGGGTDNSRVQITGVVDVTALGTPTVLNAENGFLTGSTGNDTLTISGAQLDALIFGAGTIDFNGGVSDTINLTTTSADLNALGLVNASIAGLENISAITAAAAVTLTLSGQTEDFTLTGSVNNDNITAGSGDDIIDAAQGSDIVNAGAGNDSIFGRGGNDVITGGAGVDNINGNDGNDTIQLANGDFGVGESIDGGNNTDEIILTNATTVDFTTGTLSNLETLTGSTGNDDVTIEINTLGQFITADLAGGIDVIRTQIDGIYDATVSGVPTVSNTENGFLVGSANSDTLTANNTNLANLIYGTGTIDMGAGSDTINIVEESALLNTLGLTDASINNLETISAATVNANLTINMSAQSEDFTLIGGTRRNTILGGSGDDSITGNTDDDTFTGGAGADVITGDAGDDEFNLANGDFDVGEILNGGADNDIIILTNATTVDFQTGTLIDIEELEGSGGNDIVTVSATQYIGFTNDVDLRGGTDIFNVFADNSDISAFTDPTVTTETGNLIGDGADNSITLTGNQLNRILVGSGIVDLGGGANDVINLTTQSNDLNNLGSSTDAEVQGVETISYALANADLTLDMSAQTEDLILIGGSGRNDIYGGSGDDTITGGSDRDDLFGGDGDDVIIGGDGNDNIYGSDNSAQTAVADILAANPSVTYDESTGNFYQYVATTGTWATQQAAAAATNLNGVAGHLTVVSSAHENGLLTTLSSSARLWIGGNDATTEGEWFWTEGPEAGTQFWTGGAGGGAVGGLYSNWVAGDPSNGSGTWDYIEHRADGTWWSNANGQNLAYVIEWEGDAVLGTTGTDTLYGGDGRDELYGTDGVLDVFVLEAATAYNDVDRINNFTAADGDAIDISDLLTGFVAGTSDINSFVRLTNSGGNMNIEVDANGTTGGASFTTVGRIENYNDLDVDALYYNQSIIA